MDVDASAEQWLADRRVFSVLGAMKAGTCSLRQHLRAYHWQDNLALPWQEPHFFDDDEQYARGPAHYVSWFGWDDEWGVSCSPAVVGDVTPSYLYLPEAVPRLRRIIPHARLVVMLRNPLDRVVSQHNHDLAKGRPVGRMRERWEQELAQHALSLPPSRHDIFGRGLYYLQLERLLRHFPWDQVLVVISERYRKNPHRELKRIRAFLGLSQRRDKCEDLPECHVRGPYLEVLPAADRAELRALYSQDVLRLKCLLQDSLPEWSDFACPVPAEITFRWRHGQTSERRVGQRRRKHQAIVRGFWHHVPETPVQIWVVRSSGA